MMSIPQTCTVCGRCDYLLQRIEYILIRQLSPSGVMPAAPEQERTYPERRSIYNPSEPNSWYWGVTDNDYGPNSVGSKKK